jgi:hypothetical protein
MRAQDVTELLGVEPSEANDAGALLENSRGRVRKVPRTGWFLSSAGHVSSRDLRDHLDWLIEKLSGVRPGLQKLQEAEGVKMSVSCVWWSVSGHGGPVLWPEQMEALGRYNLECAFDVYFDTDE